MFSFCNLLLVLAMRKFFHILFAGYIVFTCIRVGGALDVIPRLFCIIKSENNCVKRTFSIRLIEVIAGKDKKEKKHVSMNCIFFISEIQ